MKEDCDRQTASLHDGFPARAPLPLPLIGMASLPLPDSSGESLRPESKEDEDEALKCSHSDRSATGWGGARTRG
jgi:hypothetical protein